MTVVYRGVWAEEPHDATDRVLTAFRDWVTRKSGGELSVPEEGTSAGQASTWTGSPGSRRTLVHYPAQVSVQRARAGERSIVRAAVVEDRPDGSRWKTTARTWTGFSEPTGEVFTWVWVDVEAVFDTYPEHLVVTAPALVHDLLAHGRAPRRGPTNLTPTATIARDETDAEDLAALLTDFSRDVPVVVFDLRDAGQPWPGPHRRIHAEAAMAHTARGIAGALAVHGLQPAAACALTGILGKEFAVPDGSFRTYLAGFDPARANEARRHRVTSGERYRRSTSTACTLITQALGPVTTTRRAPGSYAQARELIAVSIDEDLDTWQELAESAEKESARLREELMTLQRRYMSLTDEHQHLRDELADVRQQLQVIAAPPPARPATGTPRPSSRPREARNATEAAQFAREHLPDHLALPPDALVDLALLDAAPQARAWGAASWQAFQALAAYAEAQGRAAGGEQEGFWMWCKQSRHPLAWRATSKKLAMKESETVHQNTRLWAKRMLPVAQTVHPSGHARMEAHIKIAEGGGDLAPRIYFLHHEGSQMVHVGFFGPHKHMPNTKT